MSRRILFLSLSIVMIVLAAGCAPECEEGDYASFIVIPESPTDGTMISYQNPPYLDWTHQEDCKPAQYRIKIKDLVTNGSVSFVRSADESNIPLSIIMDLKPNRDYEWYVQAASLGLQNISPPSQSLRFKTDGLCDVDQLVPPILLTPQDGTWKKFSSGSNNARLEWLYPEACFPEYYHYQLAADPDFTNIITSGITEFSDYYSLYYPPGETSWIRSPHSYKRVTVPECARVYWRVEARRGNASGGYSETFRFTNAADFSCWQNQQSIDAALIKGYVFIDQCDTTVPYVPDGVDIWPPCTFGEPYGVHGDGNRARGSGEPGEANVIVDLGSGPCPSTGLDEFVTQSNGMYYFMVQSPGEYCVSVSKTKNPQLSDGIWTNPLTDQDVTGQTLMFTPGETQKSQNFGWDPYDYIEVDFHVDVLSACRQGDSAQFPVELFLPAGRYVQVIARNESSTWYLTTLGCYLSIATGEPADNDIPIYPLLPPPEPQIIENQPTGKSQKPCSNYDDPGLCEANGCRWVYTAVGPGICTNP